MGYARKVKADKGSTILSLQEQKDMEESFEKTGDQNLEFTGKHKSILVVFAFSFAIMVISLIPWGSFGITIFDGWTSFLTGESFGDWYFGDLAMWFFLVSLVVSLIQGFF